MVERHLGGRAALVTGAAHGIGFGIADEFARHGARVLICDLDPEAGEAAAVRLRDRGDQVTFVKTDVSSPDSIAALAAVTGEIDILVNNAGIISTALIEEIDLAHWHKVFAVNVDGPFLLIRAFLPGMKARRHGRIINIASVAGHNGGGLLGDSCYAASKGAVIALTKGVAREAGAFGVTANAICPALTESDMTHAMPTDIRDRIIAGMPVGHAGRPEDIAAAVVFLASEEARMINGDTLDVDGGFMRR